MVGKRPEVLRSFICERETHWWVWYFPFLFWSFPFSAVLSFPVWCFPFPSGFYLPKNLYFPFPSSFWLPSLTCKIIWVCNALHSSNSKRSIHPSTRFCLVDTWKQAENETCPLVQQVEGVRSVRWAKTADSMQGFAAWLARPWLKRARLCSLDAPDYGRHVTLLVV